MIKTGTHLFLCCSLGILYTSLMTPRTRVIQFIVFTSFHVAIVSIRLRWPNYLFFSAIWTFLLYIIITTTIITVPPHLLFFSFLRLHRRISYTRGKWKILIACFHLDSSMQIRHLTDPKKDLFWRLFSFSQLSWPTANTNKQEHRARVYFTSCENNQLHIKRSSVTT